LKSRIIVWTVVGIIALIGVVVIATAPKTGRGPKVTPDMVKSEVERAEAQLERLAVRLSGARKATAPGADTSNLAQADQLLAEAREKLAQVKQEADAVQAQQLLIDGRETLRRARRAVELAAKSGSRPRGMY